MEETQEKMSPEEEIKKLEQQLEAKKREFIEAGNTAPLEKEIFSEVLKERIEELRPSTMPETSTESSVSTPTVEIPVYQESRQAEVKKAEAIEATVRVLVEKVTMGTGTIEDAIKEAQKISPYVVDELHGRLVENYDKLVALGKIKKL